METAFVKYISPVAENVHHVVLEFRVPQSFLAGQHLKLWLAPGTFRSYSIASSTKNSRELDIFIGHQGHESAAQTLLKEMAETRQASVTLPFGKACYRNTGSRRTLLIAGGTGYSYVRSILLETLLQSPDTRIKLLWDVRKKECLFDTQTLDLLAQQNDSFTYQIWLEEPGTRGFGNARRHCSGGPFPTEHLCRR